ncbi:MAG: OsmC family protein [Anaerolineae bacterium]|nr:OsmC family protein [Anaerolineae bacterium]
MVPFATSVTAHPVGEQNYAIVTYKDSQLVVGAPYLRDTGTKRSQPTDLLLAALATDCTFACQRAAQQLNIPLNNMNTTVEWLNAVEEASSNERNIRVRMALWGPNAQQAAELVEAIKRSSKTYEMLAAGVAIIFETTL